MPRTRLPLPLALVTPNPTPSPSRTHGPNPSGHLLSLRSAISSLVTPSTAPTRSRYYFDHKFLVDVVGKICNNVRGVNRVCQDITSKPPATIEWE